MSRERSFHLVAAVLLLSVVSILLTELSAADVISPPFYVGWIVAMLNVMAALAGLWTPHRLAWGAYLVLSLAALVLIGAGTAISGLWLLSFFLR